MMQPYDIETGAGTFNPSTFLRVLGPEPWNGGLCRAVAEGRRTARYGENPNRLQHYYQYQVILKPSPLDVQELYLDRLRELGLDPLKHDVRFVEDDWESPTLGAWGLGWEVWLDGMEITQFTYFQQVGGIDLKPVSAEITYGLERIAMYLQQVDNVYDLELVEGREVRRRAPPRRGGVLEIQLRGGRRRDAVQALRDVRDGVQEVKQGRARPPGVRLLPEMLARVQHAGRRGAVSVTERTGYIARVRNLARMCAEELVKLREEMGFPDA